MAQVDVVINNRPYRIACDDGQEQHLSRLAEYVDQRVQELVAGAVRELGSTVRLVATVGAEDPAAVAEMLAPALVELDKKSRIVPDSLIVRVRLHVYVPELFQNP